MYRLVLLCFLVQAISGHGCHNQHEPCRWRHSHRHRELHENDGDFHKISWDIVNIDRKISRICNGENHLTESFQNNYYKLSASLPDFSEDEIKVLTKHRVLIVQAIKPGVNVFSEIKVLPEHVNPTDSSWSLEGGKLTILFNYREPLGTEIIKGCSGSFNTTVLEVPKALKIDARFGGDDATTGLPLNENAV